MKRQKKIIPPLSFVGNKGFWGQELSELAHKLPSECTVIDVFGGSGLCAECIKRARPDLTVIWNDFDNYKMRLDNAEKTESLRQALLAEIGYKPKGDFAHPLTDKQHMFVLDILRRQLADHGFVDFQTIAGWFSLYMSNPKELKALTTLTTTHNFKLYNRIPTSPLRLTDCHAWLSGVHRTCSEFTGIDTIFHTTLGAVKLRDFIDTQSVFLVLDPPYIGKNNTFYKGENGVYALYSTLETSKYLPSALFGDESVAFRYSETFKNTPYFSRKKQVPYLRGGKRVECLFARFPFNPNEGSNDVP